MIKLYRDLPDGIQYWEAWDDGNGTAVVHEGRVGDPGQSTVVREVDDFADWVVGPADAKKAEGFEERPAEEHNVVAVQVPRDSVPSALEEVDATWTRLEHWMNETLGWAGVGHCASMDLSGPLTAFGDVVDIEAALSVLSQNLELAGLPDGVVIAVLEDDYVVRWPADRAGEPLEE
jgi:hypothetical protein